MTQKQNLRNIQLNKSNPEQKFNKTVEISNMLYHL